jgi:hypothetical protein
MAVQTSSLRGVIYAGRLMVRDPLPARPDPDASVSGRDW